MLTDVCLYSYTQYIYDVCLCVYVCGMYCQVGSWSRSISINTEGHLLMQGSQWSQQQQQSSSSSSSSSSSAAHATSTAAGTGDRGNNKQKDKQTAKNAKKSIRAGATVGFLVFLPGDDTADTAGQGTSDSQRGASTDGSHSAATTGGGSVSGMLSERSAYDRSNKTVNSPTTALPNADPAPSLSSSEHRADPHSSSYVYKVHIDGVPCEYSSECHEAIRHVMADIQRFNTPLFPTVSLLVSIL